MSENRAEGRRNTRGRRPRRAAARPGRVVSYRNLSNPFPPMRVFSDDEVAEIHQTALRVLEDLGMRILLPRAREVLAAAGAVVTDDMVRIDRGLVSRALETAPGEITAYGGSPEDTLRFGGNAVTFSAVGGAPYAMDLDRGKRPGTLEDYRTMIRLCQSYDVIHMLAAAPEPQDIEARFRHLEATRVQLYESGKLPTVYARGTAQVRDCFHMIRVARGIPDDGSFSRRVWCKTVINTNSPRQIDIPMAQGIIDFAEAGQLLIVTPFCLAGAMAPVTVSGALALQHAEALAAIVLGQAVSPGAPMMYGSFCSNVDMKSGAPAFGTPEHVKSLLGSGQLARHIGLPWRSGAGTASNLVDAQATYETHASLWGAIMAGSDLVVHAAGWIEGGLSASFEKFIVDVEMLQGFAELFLPLPATGRDIGFDAISEVEPGGHFFAASHTMERYDTAFYEPLVSDMRNFGQWQQAGGLSAAERANGIWKKAMAEFEPPPFDPARREEIDRFVERRTGEGGAPPLS